MTGEDGWPHAAANDIRPLRGLRVLDLSRILAGPLCAMLLADLGADVVKVEAPTGDEIRRWGPPFVGDNAAYHFVPNRNKWLITLDLATEHGQSVVTDLIRRTDVVIHNFTADVADTLRVDFDRVVALNPQVIYLSISGFGPAQGNRPGFDLVAQATSGLMSVTGDPRTGPAKVGVAVSDIAAAHYGIIGILAAVAERGVAGLRDASRLAVRLDVALQDATLALMSNHAANWLGAGVVGRQRGNDHPSVAPYSVYTTGDGLLAIAVGTDRQFANLCEALDIEQLSRDPDYLTNAGRQKHHDSLRERLEAALGTGSASQWHEVLDRAGVPNGRIRSVAEALDDPDCELVGTVAALDGEPIRLLLTPIRYNGAYFPPYLAPAAVGAHTEAVLTSLGQEPIAEQVSGHA